jgi:DNA-binding NarL/FixJ family response regulator
VPVRLVDPGGVELDEPETEPTGLDLRILSLLMVGATDAAIAKQLGLGLRTVQRRVAHMMDLAKVSTRLQLGWHACHRGWLG